MPFSFELIQQSLPFLLQGALYTIGLSVGGMGFGLLIGFALALMRRSKPTTLPTPRSASTERTHHCLGFCACLCGLP